MMKIIQKYTGVPFSYGQDCCQFVGECVEAVTGRNPMNRYHYGSEGEALDIIAQYGDLCAAITANLGEPYDGFKDGDVCLVESESGEQIAGVAWQGRVIVRAKRDLMDLPRTHVKYVWMT